MSNQTRSTNIAIFTRACWLAGFSLAGVMRSCRRAGATQAEIASAVLIYTADQNALVRVPIIQHGAHLDRRAAS
jgi:hypothetical protein